MEQREKPGMKHSGKAVLRKNSMGEATPFFFLPQEGFAVSQKMGRILRLSIITQARLCKRQRKMERTIWLCIVKSWRIKINELPPFWRLCGNQ